MHAHRKRAYIAIPNGIFDVIRLRRILDIDHAASRAGCSMLSSFGIRIIIASFFRKQLITKRKNKVRSSLSRLVKHPGIQYPSNPEQQLSLQRNHASRAFVCSPRASHSHALPWSQFSFRWMLGHLRGYKSNNHVV
jgi:hypothetical protein